MILHLGAQLLLGAVLSVPAAPADLAKIDRTLVKEPAYQGKPRYCLLVFGMNAERRMWVVQDGKTLYADCNGDGDLTDANERFEDLGPSKLANDPVKLQWRLPVKWPATSASNNLMLVSTGPEGVLGAILMLQPGAWEVYGFKPEHACNQQAWLGVAPADQPSRAPIIHLAGPLTFVREEALYETNEPLKRGEPQELRVHIGTPGFGKRSFSSIQELTLPNDVHPVAEFEYPAKLGGKPIRATCVLDKRC